MDLESIEVSKFLIQFRPLIFKTLQRLNIQKRSMDYEDFFQELQIHLLSIRESMSDMQLEKESDRYTFTAYASQGLYWHGLNLIRQCNQSESFPMDVTELEWMDNFTTDNATLMKSDIYLHDFFIQAKKRLTDEEYLLLLYLAEGIYTIQEIADSMQISRDTVYQRKKIIKKKLENLKECLMD